MKWCHAGAAVTLKLWKQPAIGSRSRKEDNPCETCSGRGCFLYNLRRTDMTFIFLLAGCFLCFLRRDNTALYSSSWQAAFYVFRRGTADGTDLKILLALVPPVHEPWYG